VSDEVVRENQSVQLEPGVDHHPDTPTRTDTHTHTHMDTEC